MDLETRRQEIGGSEPRRPPLSRADHDQLKADHDQLKADHDQLKADHDQLKADHDKLVAEVADLADN